MERWQMNRLGFVNFWLYDTDVFPLKDGKLLLRGTNGSGKSITTQSFIPFILDGDKQPSRLDPFGSKDRKMSWYLIGDAETGKDESTAYLYLEFIKPESQQFRTIGIGLHAKKGGTMKMWGFCLSDGRRVGIDFPLYKKVGDSNIPHEASLLKNQLASDSRNIFVEKQSDYKEMVAEQIFGINKEQISDFDQLTNILIKTRSSKLSKDNLKPAQLYSILNESLQILSDEDLRPMADAMSKIEDKHNKIEEAEKSLAEVKLISSEYEKYNRYMLWKKASAYRNKSYEALDIKKQIKTVQNDIDNSAKEKEDATLLRDKTNIHTEDLKREKSSLNITDINEQIEKKKDAQQKLELNKNDFDKKQKKKDEKEEKLRTYNREILETTANINNCDYENKNAISELESYSDYAFPFHENYIDSAKNKKDFCDSTNQCRKEQQNLEQRLKSVLKKLEEQKSKYDKREEMAVTLLEAENALKKSENQFTLSQNAFYEEKDKIIESLHISANNNTEFLIDDKMLEELEICIANYEGKGSANNINDIFSQKRDTLYSDLCRLIANAEAQKNEAQNELDRLTKELHILENTAEPVPERSEEKENARKTLQENKIEFLSFYECIDFKENVNAAQRAFVESALSDMGLLDALVIPESQYKKFENILGNISDNYICTDKNSSCENKFFDITVGGELREETEKIISFFEENTCISPEGFYCNGILKGHSSDKLESRFIGAESRKAYRLYQIKQLSEKCDNAQENFKKLSETCDSIKIRLEIFNDEYTNRPDFSDINTALDLFLSSEKQLETTKNSFLKAETNYHNADNEYKDISAQTDALCREFPKYKKTKEFYEEVLDAVNDYYQLIYQLIDGLKQLKQLSEKLKSINEQKSDIEYDLDELQYELLGIEKRIHENEEIIRLCDEFLSRPDIADISKRYLEIDAIVSENEKIILKCSEKISECETDIKHYEKRISELNETFNEVSAEENILCEYFKEELKLGFVLENENKSVSQLADESLKALSTGDDKKSIQEISERLERVFRQNINILSMYYRPMMTMQFTDLDSERVRARHIITLTWLGKQISPKEFEIEIKNTIDHDRLLMKKEEEEMFKDTLINTISRKLYYKINECRRWIDEMSELMKSINTSMGLTFSLSWKPRKDIGENEMKFDELYKLLIKDSSLINPEDLEKLSNHFRSKIEHERLIFEEQETEINYTELVKNVMDFRNWFEFKIYSKEASDPKPKELTNSRFNTFSGGERALSLYIPLFAAVAAQYKKAGEQAPMIIALDEAFAGVDESNISEMFGLLEKLGFGYIINSQALWGCYDTVPALEIAELYHEKESGIITVIYYEWNGKKKVLDDIYGG
ncbi:MAG: hypothetical protein J6A58_02205 [Oscillospiraceae bacterium]|nr:hypothetical protein [Oscillospiraceae bacterium]